MDELPEIARQAIAAALDLVRWDQAMNDKDPTSCQGGVSLASGRTLPDLVRREKY